MFLPLMITIICAMISENMYSSQQPLPPYLSFSPTANPTYHYDPEIINTINPTISPTITCTATSLSYAVAMALRDYIAPTIHKLYTAVTHENYALLKTMIHHYLWKYRYIIAGNTLLGSYATTSIMLISDYYFMHDTQRWANWKHNLTFEELCAQPNQQLTKELILTINERHCNNQNPTDINHPLIAFINDINNEIYRINRYITIASFQKTMYLIKFFPTNETKIKNAEKLLTRTHFIRHLFLSWLTEYNMTGK